MDGRHTFVSRKETSENGLNLNVQIHNNTKTQNKVSKRFRLYTVSDVLKREPKITKKTFLSYGGV